MGQKNQGCHTSEAVGKVSQGRGTVENPSQDPPCQFSFLASRLGQKSKGRNSPGPTSPKSQGLVISPGDWKHQRMSEV